MTNIILEKLKQIKMLALDVDGVLTDGGIYIDENGGQTRRFNMQDGHGIGMLLAVGIDVAIISKATSVSVKHRAAMIGIQEVHLGANDKLAILTSLCEKKGLTLDQVAFMGDDLIDIEVLSHVGYPFAPANAVPQVLENAQYITHAKGGEGAVREVCDLLLQVNRE
jgi:3-deoxy-D-manno-octulosonate 8-phosphate phosphatase (KDO 8-P phosphatase)